MQRRQARQGKAGCAALNPRWLWHQLAFRKTGINATTPHLLASIDELASRTSVKGPEERGGRAEGGEGDRVLQGTSTAVQRRWERDPCFPTDVAAFTRLHLPLCWHMCSHHRFALCAGFVACVCVFCVSFELKICKKLGTLYMRSQAVHWANGGQKSLSCDWSIF